MNLQSNRLPVSRRSYVLLKLLAFAILFTPMFRPVLCAADSINAGTEVQPALQKPMRIRYPSALRKSGAEVTLKFLVTTDGKVAQISVVKFSDPDMITPVYDAYENARFKPGLKNGVPVDTWVTVTEKAK
ncbi:MAG: energy transducer TonB [Nibricoccus sp.]